ncbi:MAG: branched-chain amino acid ABC transporter permease [Deltaproteobacteria bacterium]|nr:branched-chain amino acid ABC transporter permease [Deltaproteobacteria bacterium]
MSVAHCGDFRQTYKDDMKVLPTRFVQVWVAAFLVLLYVFPLLASNYLISMATTIGIAVIGALGINIVTGFTGQISLGQGAFLGVGAFACSYYMREFHMPFWIAMPAAGLTTAAVGMVFGLPSARLKGLYLAIATLAAQFILEYLFMHMDFFTGGSNGISSPAPEFRGFTFESDRSKYYLTISVAVIAVLFAVNLLRSRDGRAFVAVRDHYLSAEIMGVHLFKYRLLSFSVSAFYAGIAGSLWGIYTGYITAEHFTIHESINYLAMIIIGGLGSVLGAIYGAIFMTLLPQLLTVGTGAMANIFPKIGFLIMSFKDGIFGLIVILFLIFEPDGLAHRWRLIKAYWKLYPFSY